MWDIDWLNNQIEKFDLEDSIKLHARPLIDGGLAWKFTFSDSDDIEVLDIWGEDGDYGCDMTNCAMMISKPDLDLMFKITEDYDNLMKDK